MPMLHHRLQQQSTILFLPQFILLETIVIALFLEGSEREDTYQPIGQNLITTGWLVSLRNLGAVKNLVPVLFLQLYK